jgi:hypothetical protein
MTNTAITPLFSIRCNVDSGKSESMNPISQDEHSIGWTVSNDSRSWIVVTAATSQSRLSIFPATQPWSRSSDTG